jgi:Uroporphyrinogen decarboxylase (URO-D)
MTQDRLTAEQRLSTAMRCEVPDRVPVVPLIHYFAAACGDITCADLWWDRRKYCQAITKCFDMVGGWDASFQLDVASPAIYTFFIPMRARVPGRDEMDDGPAQFLEEEIMKREDYEWMLAKFRGGESQAYTKLLTELVYRANSPYLDGMMGKLGLLRDIARQALYFRQNIKMWKQRNTAMFFGAFFEAPFDTFSCARSFMPFVDDLMEAPDLIAEAAMAAVPSFVLNAKNTTWLTKTPRFLIACHRTSNDFISPTMFKDLALPSLKAICEKLTALGISPILHCDGNWDKNIELLRELPEGSVTLQFDGATDIFRARRKLGNQFCIFGDVPALMLYQSSPEEIDLYCKRLIEEVGKDGAYIMGAGCEVPYNAKLENVQAMIQSVKKYGYYQ